MKQISLIVLFSSFFLMNSFAQEKTLKSTTRATSRIEKADKAFNELAYVKAAKLYEQLVRRTKDSAAFAQRLGDSYFNLKEMSNAEKWYEISVRDTSVAPIYVLRYAQVLQSNEKYLLGQKWMLIYHKRQSDDLRAALYAENIDYLNDLKKLPIRYVIRNMEEINSELSDFGAIDWKNKVVYTTENSASPIIKFNYSWNDNPFLKLMTYTPSDKASKEFKSIGTKINTIYHDGPICFDSSGTVAYFTRNNYFRGKSQNDDKELNNLVIIRAEFIDGKWSQMEILPFCDRSYAVGHAALSSDNKRLYFTSNMPGGYGGTDLYYVKIVNGNYGLPINLGPQINTAGNEMFPCITEKSIYFSSDAHLGFGGLDIFRAKMDATGAITNVANLGGPVNSPRDDFSFVLNKDKTKGYLASNRAGGKGSDDIYAFTRSERESILVEGIVAEKGSNRPFVNSVVLVKDENGNSIERLKTDEMGAFSYTADLDKFYQFTAVEKNYKSASETVITNDASPDIIRVKLLLEKEPLVTLNGTIKDRETDALLSGVSVRITDVRANNVIMETATVNDGAFTKLIENAKIGDVIDFRILLAKDGYLTRSVRFRDTLKQLGPIYLTEFLNKVAIGTDIGEIIDIKPIYFDVNKSDIRPDAEVELDKIVKVMAQNPNMAIELGSHTDCRASAAYNLALSDRRAKASAAYIISQGISKDRIKGKGYGEKKLVNDCACEGNVKSTCSDEEHQENRRTEFIVTKL